MSVSQREEACKETQTVVSGSEMLDREKADAIRFISVQALLRSSNVGLSKRLGSDSGWSIPIRLTLYAVTETFGGSSRGVDPNSNLRTLIAQVVSLSFNNVLYMSGVC